MDVYEQISVVGEGSYGVVLKCKHKETGRLVAIKKFLETSNMPSVRKMALREIKMLKSLHHDHLVKMIDVFRRKGRFYLVFEYLDKTLLDELEANPKGLGDDKSRKYIFQIIRGLEYCHQNNVVHRDIKPENVLVCSSTGIVKLCDFGFARKLTGASEPYTAYVATRWYRAPELLVGDSRYGPEVDIWAVGCLFAEMLTGDAIFPGETDIDQLSLITKAVGKLAPRHQQQGVSLLPAMQSTITGVGGGYRGLIVEGITSGLAKDLLATCLRTEPRSRPSAATLLRHRYFTNEGFSESFSAELNRKLLAENLISFTSNETPQTFKNCKIGVTKMGYNISYATPPRPIQVSMPTENRQNMMKHTTNIKSIRPLKTIKDEPKLEKRLNVKSRRLSYNFTNLKGQTDLDRNLGARRQRDTSKDDVQQHGTETNGGSGVLQPGRYSDDTNISIKGLSNPDKSSRFSLRHLETIKDEYGKLQTSIGKPRRFIEDIALPYVTTEVSSSSKTNKTKNQSSKLNASEWEKKYQASKASRSPSTLPYV